MVDHPDRPTSSNGAVTFCMTAYGSGMSSLVIVTKTREQTGQVKAEVEKLTMELKSYHNKYSPFSNAKDDTSQRTIGEKRPWVEKSSGTDTQMPSLQAL
ncbi:unnamed protein product [Phytophthora lilii]|uniref:Unnamed protein product n=1 Tax=Phytophthora lilii TaxID=2077276 RepID=A0A9W6TKK4_9STRA|nr:unnamed protein product [Phytophthora lilii]